MILLQYLNNENTPGYADSGNIDWLVVWHYTIIVLVVLACAIASWAIVNFMFSPKWKEHFVRAVMSGGFRKK